MRAETYPFSVLIIEASEQGGAIDPRLKELAKELKDLKFKSYALKDEVAFALELGASSRMQLPNKEWLQLHARHVLPDGKLRIELGVEKQSFRATLAIAPGGRVVVPGPRYGDGILLIAAKRLEPR